MPMKVTTYDDVLIDVCPSCRGVWLDRGELQKIIAHVRAEESGEIGEDFSKPSRPPEREPAEQRYRDDRRDRDDRGYRESRRRDDGDDDRKHNKKKGGWGLWDVLEDLID